MGACVRACVCVCVCALYSTSPCNPHEYIHDQKIRLFLLFFFLHPKETTRFIMEIHKPQGQSSSEPFPSTQKANGSAHKHYVFLFFFSSCIFSSSFFPPLGSSVINVADLPTSFLIKAEDRGHYESSPNPLPPAHPLPSNHSHRSVITAL